MPEARAPRQPRVHLGDLSRGAIAIACGSSRARLRTGPEGVGDRGPSWGAARRAGRRRL